MTALHPPTAAGRRRFGRTVAFSLATALAGTTAIAAIATAAPAAAAGTEFASSFEPADAEPVLTGFGDPINVTGDRFAPGSLLPSVVDVTASGDNPPNETVDKLADGLSTTKWLARSGAGWAQYDFDEPVSFDTYTLTSGNDASERDPQAFTVQGSNDGRDWTDIDSRSDESFDGRGLTKTYELDERSEEFTHLRLNITAISGTQDLLQLADWDLIDSQAAGDADPAHLSLTVNNGPTSSHVAKSGVGFSGTQALQYSGRHIADGPASSTSTLFSDADIAIAEDSQLSYKVFPVLDGEQTYAATFVAVDLVLDGDEQATLSGSGALDVYGFGAGAAAQGSANVLWPDQWNSVTVDLGQFAGRTVTEIRFTYDHPVEGIRNIEQPSAATAFTGWLDDVTIDRAVPRDTSEGLVSYVDTRRGTNSTGGFSRGNNIPAAAWPNGFNFITPMTNADNVGTVYHYQRENSSANLPGLNGIGFSHQPSIWMGDRNQLAVLPAATADPTSNLNDRRLAFRHENEVARPDIYAVRFENGIETAVTPTDHGAIYRFTFSGDTGSVLVDRLNGESDLTVDEDGTVSGWVNGGSGYPGRTTMFVYGELDATPTAAGATTVGNRGSARYAAFDTSSDKTVELRIASSFISAEQAAHNFALELEGVSFETAHGAVMDAWNDRLEVVTDVRGASDQQLVTLYSSLYRLNLYPNSQFENTGTAAAPRYRYASPVSANEGDSASDASRDAKIVDGKIYVNNGFWDTYRTAWPAYALLYPEQSEELVDGFVEQYREGGWIARWSSPGYADLMTGTSSDVAFAEAYLAGSLSTELALEAYDAAVKNATVLPASNAVGRKGLDTSIFLGYTQESTHESASWGLEGFINDFGIAEMAKRLAEDEATPTERVQQLTEEAEYFEARAKHYVEMYNPDAGVFTARYADGSWPADVDKKAWGGAFTEASGWTFAFHAPHDVDGLAALYGGREGLLNELHEFLTEREKADYSGIHEAREARDVRLGMLGMSNQIAHHIPYVLAEAGDPSGAQELIRDIQQRLFVGSDIGQGYPGDEDNGEFSAWYVFSALGFYPLEVGSGNYTIGSPLFDSATLDIDGTTLTINAEGAGSGQVYVDGVTINGTAIEDTTFDGDLIRNGGTLTFDMSDTPSSWGAKDLDEALAVPEVLVDATKPGFGTLTAAGGTAVGNLVDDTMRSAVTFAGDTAELTWRSASGSVAVHQYTLTSTTGSGVGAPSEWTLEGSTDGETWTELDARTDQEFPFDTQTRPFSVADHATGYTQFRLTVSAAEGTQLGLAEIELFAQAADAGELAVVGADDQRVRVGSELDGQLATITGADVETLGVTVDFGDGSEPVEGAVASNGLGGWSVTAPHAFERAGVYSVTVSATDASGVAASATTQVTAFRDDTLVGAFNNVCIGDEGAQAGDCDAQTHSFNRVHLEESGFDQGTTVEIGETGLSFDLPDVAPGEPDNVTGESQSFALDLGEGATQISVIGTATESDKEREITLTFADGSTQTLPVTLGDWVGKANNPAFDNVVVGTSDWRLRGIEKEPTADKKSAIFATAPLDLDTDDEGDPKTVVSVTMPEEPGTLRNQGRIHVFAFGSDGERVATELSVTAAEVPAQQVDEEFTAELATVESGRDLAEADVTVNWGDATALSESGVVDGAVSGTHAYAEAGTYTVWVTVDDGVQSASASLEIVVEEGAGYSPQISLDPEVVRPGGSFAVSGTGFAPEESVTVTLGTDTTVTADSSVEGAIAAELVVPADAADGDYPVVALGAVSNVEARASVRVESEVSGPVATSVALTASTDSPVVNETFQLTATVGPEGAAGQVELFDGEATVGTATVSGGVATVDVAAPTSGLHSYNARFTPDDPEAFGPSASADLVLEVRSAPVLSAEIELSATEVAQGGSLQVTGRGFAPEETVVVELHSDPVTLGEGVTDAAGAFRLEVTIPADAALGAHTVVATGAGSELVAEAALRVVTADDGSGDGSGNGTDDGQRPGGWLPRTGAGVTGLVTAMLALLVAGGIALGMRRRETAASGRIDEG